MMHYLEVIENPEWWAASQHLGWLFRGEADHVTRNMILAETRTRILAYQHLTGHQGGWNQGRGLAA